MMGPEGMPMGMPLPVDVRTEELHDALRTEDDGVRPWRPAGTIDTPIPTGPITEIPPRFPDEREPLPPKPSLTPPVAPPPPVPDSEEQTDEKSAECPDCNGTGYIGEEGVVEECATCKGEGVVAIKKKKKKAKKRRKLTDEEIRAEEERKRVALEKFRSMPSTPDMFKPCHMVGDEMNCEGPDGKFFLANSELDIETEWEKAPKTNWFRPTTIEKHGKKCYYQIQPEGAEPGQFNCAKHALVRNRIDEEALLGDPQAVHQCPHCREAFRDPKSLKSHIDRAHKDLLDKPADGEAEGEPTDESAEEKITCPVCFTQFDNKEQWERLNGECPNGCGKVEIE
jgi:uncharacterized C2H2 Zn-finger protein